MSRNQGGIPRWLTGINLVGILVALAVVVPMQGRASHSGAPANLCVCFRLSSTAPKLTWSDSSNANLIQGYVIQRSRSADFSSDVIEIRVARNTFDFIDETLSFNTTFRYRIASYAGTDRSAWSNTYNADNGGGTAPPRPATPTNLSVHPDSGGLRISWTNPATNETGVWVQRSGDGGTTWEYRASLSLNSTTFLDTDPPQGAPMYRIATFNSGGASTSYAVQYVNQGVQTPSVGQVSIPAVSIPGVPSLTGIPTVSIPGVPTVSIPGVPSVSIPGVPSIATPSVSIPTVIPSTIIPTIPALPDPNKLGLWVGLIIDNGQPSGIWLVGCLTFTCAPPPTTRLNCTARAPGTTFQFCYFLDTDPYN